MKIRLFTCDLGQKKNKTWGTKSSQEQKKHKMCKKSKGAPTMQTLERRATDKDSLKIIIKKKHK